MTSARPGAQRRQARHVVAGRQHAHIGAVFVLHHLADGDGDVEAGGAGVVGGERHGRRQLDVFGVRRGQCQQRYASESDRRERHQPTDHGSSSMVSHGAKVIFVGWIMSSRIAMATSQSRFVAEPLLRGQIVAELRSDDKSMSSAICVQVSMIASHLSFGNHVVEADQDGFELARGGATRPEFPSSSLRRMQCRRHRRRCRRLRREARRRARRPRSRS